MNRFDKNNDELRAFFNAAESEQAPAGFSVKLMELVRQDPAPVAKQKFSLSAVPVIYCIASAILVIAALLIPTQSNEAAKSFSWLPDFNISLPEIPRIDLSLFANITIPETLTYIMISCLALFVFDLFLFRYFNATN
jgi:hypothetical protein